MRWYEGDIAQAVSISKKKNAIFVVYVEGKDDKSTNLTSLINDGEVSSKLESDQFVAIKVEAGSVSHTQFSAIYKNVPVPSVYFIGKNGKPIDIIVDSSSTSELFERISSIIETHVVMTPTPSQSVTSQSVSQAPISTTVLESTSKNLSVDFIQKEQTTAEVEEKPSNVKCENGVCYRVDAPANGANAEAEKDENKELTPEEKVERAKELVEIARELKKKEEEEQERAKEIERRKTGQDVQKLRRWQQDQELKNLMEERQRAKNEEKAARDRILAQIAQDKADRAARFGRSPPPVATQPETVRPTQPSGSNSNSARLQFRLPDGSSRTENFHSDDSLQTVRTFVVENLNLPFKNFTLSTTFPRREFTSDDLDTSLRELELCPNAVILILPATNGSPVVATQGGGFMSLIWFILSPILGVFGYFRNLIFGAPENTSAETVPDKNKRGNADPDPSQQSNKRKATESTVVRRQGGSNIHRLSDRTDSDDDNNTWNGNSTQQM